MAARGLGKGLDALFAGNIEEEKIEENEKVLNLNILEVEPNRNQPRKNFDDKALQELASSIKEHGVFQPIIAKKIKDLTQTYARSSKS